MNDLKYQEALKAATRLTKLSDDALYEQLGMRLKDKDNPGGEDRVQQYSADYAESAAALLSTNELKKFGKLWWDKLEPKLQELVCSENKELALITGNKTLPEIAASLATATLVASLAPPAWIIVATSIFASKIVETGLDTLCDLWKEKINANQPPS
jgi:hypothetical protein